MTAAAALDAVAAASVLSNQTPYANVGCGEHISI